MTLLPCLSRHSTGRDSSLTYLGSVPGLQFSNVLKTAAWLVEERRLRQVFKLGITGGS